MLSCWQISSMPCRQAHLCMISTTQHDMHNMYLQESLSHKAVQGLPQCSVLMSLYHLCFVPALVTFIAENKPTQLPCTP